MTKRIRKAQVTQLIDKVSAMPGSVLQYHDLEKVWNPHRERYSWRVSLYNTAGQWIHKYVGDNLAECLEYFESEEYEAQWREDQQAKWEAAQ